jgi:HK97 family phage major capsid protein
MPSPLLVRSIANVCLIARKYLPDAVCCPATNSSKDANNRRKENTMSKLIELREKRTRLISEAQQIVQADVVTNEHRAKFDAMLADVETMEADITRLEKVEKLEAETRSTHRPPRSNPESNQNADVQSRAFEKYIRYGKDYLNAEERIALRGGFEQRDVTTVGGGSNTNGGYLIPQLFNPSLIDAQKLIGNTVSIVGKRVTNNNGAPIKVALSNDTGNVLTTMTGEATLIAEQDPMYSGFVMNTDTVGTLVKVSTQELEDSYFDLNAWLRDKFGLRYYRGLEYLITNGNGSNVASIVSTATLGATAAAATGPVFDDFTACYSMLDPAYEPNASWVMSSTTRAYIMGLKDMYGRPLFIPSPNSGTLDQILGRPVVLNQALPSAGNNVSTTASVTGILYGDFNQGYLLRTDGDLVIRRLDERFADTLETGFIAYARVGGASTDAGTHPIRTLVTPVA